ncbi:MAG: ABC transporter ATP-binding protein [Rickettsiaceae bacterium]
MASKSYNITHLLRYIRPYKLDLAIIALAIALVSFAILMFGYIFRQLIDNGLKIGNFDNLNNYILYSYCIVFIFAISSFCRSYFINNLTEKIVNQIRLDIYSKLIKIQVHHFEELKIGDLISRFTSDIDQISKFISNFLSLVIRNLIIVSFGVVLMFYQNFKLSMTIVVSVPILLIPIIFLSKYVRSLSRKVLSMQGSMASNIEEDFSNIHAVHTFNQQNYSVSKFQNNINQYLEQSAKRFKIRAIFFAFSISVILCTIIFVIYLGATDIIQCRTSSGQIMSFIYYALIIGVSSGSIVEFFSEIHTPLASLDRIFNLIEDIKDDIDLDLKKQQNLSIINISQLPSPIIEFQNVSFCYPSRPNDLVLDGINFQINKGDFIGIVGRSGSGKSTILQLLLKFFINFDGKINISNTSISDIDTNSLRNILSYVPQDPSIFSGTIAHNIAFSKPCASKEEISNIANIAQLSYFIDNLKYKFDTVIGQRGVRLSGGQKQRIAIARALLYNSEILLLDEATSALDLDTEKQVLLDMHKAMKGKTIISVAHRISTIEKANKILIIDKGKLVDEGNHRELLKRSELYQAFCFEKL